MLQQRGHLGREPINSEWSADVRFAAHYGLNSDIEELKPRFLVVQAVEAARTVEDHVITDMREADVGSILGFGFAPFTGGTLSYIDFMGTRKFVELCHKLEAKYGSRFTPPKLLEDMAASGETFYGRFPPKKLAEKAA